MNSDHETDLAIARRRIAKTFHEDAEKFTAQLIAGHNGDGKPFTVDDRRRLREIIKFLLSIARQSEFFDRDHRKNTSTTDLDICQDVLRQLCVATRAGDRLAQKQLRELLTNAQHFARKFGDSQKIP